MRSTDGDAEDASTVVAPVVELPPLLDWEDPLEVRRSHPISAHASTSDSSNNFTASRASALACAGRLPTCNSIVVPPTGLRADPLLPRNFSGEIPAGFALCRGFPAVI